MKQNDCKVIFVVNLCLLTNDSDFTQLELGSSLYWSFVITIQMVKMRISKKRIGSITNKDLFTCCMFIQDNANSILDIYGTFTELF